VKPPNNTKRKLELSRETIRALTNREATKLEGGFCTITDITRTSLLTIMDFC
jgi:hypothetical protein